MSLKDTRNKIEFKNIPLENLESDIRLKFFYKTVINSAVTYGNETWIVTKTEEN